MQREDMENDPLPHFVGESSDAEADPLITQAHKRLHPHDRAHVNLTQEEYTPEEVARLLGTSLDNVIHAIRSGDLKAKRAGRDVVCINHHDIVDWLNRGGGV
jgi:excisionase family DNA binding protein